ncbi:MAG: pseudouridine synthase RluD [Actinomycetota bacterium]
MIEETIPAALAGERLDRIVALLADVSRSDASAVIASDGVRVDGVIAHSGKQRMSSGAVVAIDETCIPQPQRPEAEAQVGFDVVFEDPDIVVVDKPAGLVVHPAAGHHSGTLVNGLLARYPEIAGVGSPNRPGIVHRLDQGTSGLLVVARSASAFQRLTEMLAGHEVQRTYRALVWGRPSDNEFTIDAPIARDPQDPLRMAIVSSGKEARTHVTVLQQFDYPHMAYLECELETGRTHQIRVHLRAVGHPVVGDPVYGGARSGVNVKRPFLHAYRLSFSHPTTGEKITFQSELPEDLSGFLTHLRDN